MFYGGLIFSFAGPLCYSKKKKLAGVEGYRCVAPFCCARSCVLAE